MQSFLAVKWQFIHCQLGLHSMKVAISLLCKSYLCNCRRIYGNNCLCNLLHMRIHILCIPLLLWKNYLCS